VKKKIVIVVHTDYPWTEGMSYRVHSMASFLSNDYDVTVVSPVLEGSFPQGLEVAGQYKICRLKIGFVEKVKTNRVLYRLLFVFLFALSMIKTQRYFTHRQEIKLVQVEQQLALLPGIVLGFLWGKPIIVDDVLSPQRYYKEHSKLFKFLAYVFERFLLRRCRLIIGSHSEAVKTIHEHYNFPISKLCTIPNGVDVKPFVDLEDTLKEKSKDVIFIGSMYSEQNRGAIRNLIRIFPSICEKVRDAQLVIIGGPLFLLREVVDSVDQKNLHNRNMSILGRISEVDKKKYLKRACVCVLPYDSRDRLIGGARLKALEFLSYGKVVVSTSTGVEGIDGAISGENMIITDDLESFKDHVVKVLKHPEKYERIRKNAIELANKYQWDNILPNYIRIIKSI